VLNLYGQSSNVTVSGGKKIKACGQSYFIADSAVRIHSSKWHRPGQINREIIQETVSDTTTLCNSINMSVLTFESLAEMFCLLKMIPAGSCFKQFHPQDKYIFVSRQKIKAILDFWGERWWPVWRAGRVRVVHSKRAGSHGNADGLHKDRQFLFRALSAIGRRQHRQLQYPCSFQLLAQIALHLRA
jgi:hypothetical protein